MVHLYFLVFLTQWLALAAAKVYTGFNYGAFWSKSQPKIKKDFVQQFNLAKSLPNTPVLFDSARLFTSIQWGTAGITNDPIEAFAAAVDTNTSLLLGFWAQDEASLGNELMALEKAFKTHGSKLANLVVGLSVGNEDIYRFEHPNNQIDKGASEDQVKNLVQITREKIALSSFASLMRDKPIGHTDIQDYAPSGMDFIGMNTYPYYGGQPIEKAHESFFNTLSAIKSKAVNTPVWIGETGWPFSGKTLGSAVASVENMQKYWTNVGCSLFGKYNTWWFQLHMDSGDGADWGLIDITSQKPRIKDLSC
ncbi:glycoside hydrolase family 17 protein, partial [Melanomma pulvis-pyrius CBS 109.77]